MDDVEDLTEVLQVVVVEVEDFTEVAQIVVLVDCDTVDTPPMVVVVEPAVDVSVPYKYVVVVVGSMMT